MADFAVYVGYWRDYSADAVHQHVVSLPLQWSGFLISALALLVSVAGGFLWTILAFIIHQRRAPLAADATPAQLQLQVMLRNNHAPFTAFFQSISILRAWPKTASASIKWHAFEVTAAALLSLMAFTIAGVFVAAIASSSDADVIALVQPKTCGIWSLDLNAGDLGAYQYLFRTAVNTTLRNRAYAKSWYVETPSSTAPQSYFPIRRLPYTTTYIPCPFPGAHRCLSNESSNTAMVQDTGRLNSHLHLGINAPADQTMDLRLISTCSPVDTSDMHVRRNVSGGLETCAVKVGSGSGVIDSGDGPLTFPCRLSQDSITYTARAITYSPGLTSQLWVPNSVFRRDDAEVSMIAILQNAIHYLGPVYDPLFSANGTYSYNVTGTGIKLYQPDYFVNTLVCLNQAQFCNPNNDKCTTTAFLANAVSQAYELDLNDHQTATVRRLEMPSLLSSAFWAGLGPLGTAGLLATEQVFYDFFSPALPPDQWKQEVSLWFQTGIAKIQELLMNFVQLEILDIPNRYIDVLLPNNTDWNITSGERAAVRDQCVNQKILTRGQVQNFNLIALIVVIVISMVLIIVGLILEPCMEIWRKRKPTLKGRARQHAREIDSMFYLLRAGLEGVGVGPWRRGGDKKIMGISVMDKHVLLERSIVAGVVSDKFYQPVPADAQNPQPEKTSSTTQSGPKSTKAPAHTSIHAEPRASTEVQKSTVANSQQEAAT